MNIITSRLDSAVPATEMPLSFVSPFPYSPTRTQVCLPGESETTVELQDLITQWDQTSAVRHPRGWSGG
jgi:hypothetical protein